MLGTSPEETCQCEQLLCEIMDLRNMMVRFAYNADETTTEQDAKQLLARARANFVKLERWLMKEYPDAPNRFICEDELNTIGFAMDGVCHLVGGKFTAPDFHLWEMLDQFEGLSEKFGLCCLGTVTTFSDKVDKIQPKERKKRYPYLKEFHENFIKLKANQMYGTQYRLNAVKADDAILLPYNNPYARFGSGPGTLGKYARGQDAPWRNLGTCKENMYTRVNSNIEYWDDEATRGADEKRARWE